MFRMFVLLAALASLTAPISAQTLPDTVSSLPWALDGGRVLASADANGVLFIGGDFTSVAHPSDVIGPFGAFDGTVGGLITADPRLTGVVNAIVDDGAGGWFLGGRLVVEGEVRPLVRIDAAGRPATFAVHTEDGFVQVYALARVANTLYLGGTFATVNGQPRQKLAAVDIPSQTVLPWRADVTGSLVYALTPLASELLVGGAFSEVGGLPRTHFAAVDLVTAQVSAWAPPIVGNEVRSIAASADWLVIGGGFNEVAGQPARNLAVLDGNRLVRRLATTPIGPVQTVGLDGNTVYVAGLFDDVAGTTRYNAAAIDITTDRLLPWAPLSSYSPVLAMTVAADGVYLAGEYLQASTPGFVVKVDRTTGAADASWQPRIGGRVSALARGYGQVAMGGLFQTHRATRAAGLVAIDRATGALLPTPIVDIGYVEALALRGATLYLGGYFSRVDGQPRSGLAAIDTTTRTLQPFAPALAPLLGSPDVSALAVSGTTLYVGGIFSAIGGSPRDRLGAIDLNTGLATAFVPPVFDSTGRPFQLLVSGTRLWMTGSFTSVDGAPRGSLAVVDATTGALLPIAPITQPFALGQLVGLGGDVLVGGTFSAAAGAPRSRLARFDGTTGALQPWTAANWTANGGVAANGAQVFASGLPSLGFSGALALFDAVSGAAQGWSAVGPWIPFALFEGAGGLLATGPPSPDTAWPLYYARRSVTTGAPRALSDFGWHVQGTRLTLRWRPAMDGALPTAYRIEAGSQPGARDLASFTLPGTATGMITDAPAGRFFVRVVPTNGLDGPPSPEATFVTGAISCMVTPVAPVLTSSGGATPILRWTAPPSTGVTSYTVRAGVSSGAYGLAAIPLPADVTTMSTAGAPPGAYYVSVRATAGCGVTTDSNEVLVTVPAPTPPAAPTALTASVSGATVSLSWTPPAGAITGYVLEAGSALGLANIIPGLALGATPGLIATNVPPGAYVVRVRAASGGLVSAPSNEVTVVVP